MEENEETNSWIFEDENIKPEDIVKGSFILKENKLKKMSKFDSLKYNIKKFIENIYDNIAYFFLRVIFEKKLEKIIEHHFNIGLQEGYAEGYCEAEENYLKNNEE